MICITSILAWGIPLRSHASDLCFSNLSTAKVVAKDLTYGKFCKEKLPVVTLERDLLKASNEDAREIIINKDSQVNIYKQQSEEFKKLYVDTSQELVKSKKNTPSRLVWFSIGGITTAVLAIIGAILIKY
jgi:hypothetical protein